MVAVLDDWKTLKYPANPLGYKAFTLYWSFEDTNVRVSKGGSDYYDHCINISYHLRRLEISEMRHQSINKILSDHRQNALRDFEL